MKYCIIAKDDENSQSIRKDIMKKITLEYDEVIPDIVISIGGDGTILKAIHTYEQRIEDIVIFGIHTGHLGFITNFEVSEIDKVINQINSSIFQTEEIGLLNYEIESKEGITKGIALNETTIINPPRTLIVDVLINNTPFEHFRGTGLCISSPFGSTAYNKSLHGAVVDPCLDAFELTEIASINSNAYRTLGSSLILNKDKKVRIEANDFVETWVTVDNISFTVKKFKSITCSYNGKCVIFAQNNKGFLDRLKKAFISNK